MEDEGDRKIRNGQCIAYRPGREIRVVDVKMPQLGLLEHMRIQGYQEQRK